VVELEIVSNCTVELDLKGSNISFEKSRLEVAATNGNSITITVQGNIADKDKEYLAVIIPNGNIKELLEAR
jgi:DNA polymerase III sliding clamp (beta) subunit (PCNA family)